MIPRLKSLELHGYKTFASRTMFEYPGVITAIVGPNGSGKSNIADAIRWVLGEQSYTLLRGRKTEDMIFAGSEQRARAGMAQATITFDNSDGWLPIDYSEVAITRRAYRDGTNEYLLNGQRVRLKEISELLAQSGLAERTYTVIGQGLVDAALSLKPEERRKFFEEAAGIGLYRSRREDSLNRLEATRRNLERVHDIVNELEPRLQSLEKQARRAIEYERVKADLRLLLRDWYGYHWHRTLKDVAHSQEVVKAHDARQKAAREKSQELESQLNQKHEHVLKLRERLNLLHAQAAEKHLEREKISKNLAVLNERVKAITEQTAALDGDLLRANDEQTAGDANLKSFMEELQKARAELNDLQALAESAREQLSVRRRERDRLEKKLQTMRSELMQAEASLTQKRIRREDLTHQQVQLTNSIAETQSSIDQINRSIIELEERVKQTQAAIGGQTTLLEQISKKIAFQRESIRIQEESRSKLSKDENQLLNDKTRLETQLKVLVDAEQANIGLNQGPKTLLETSRSGKIKGTFKAISSLLRISQEYETALLAVMGESINAVVFSADVSIEEPIQLLESGEKGRVMLFPPALRIVEQGDERVDDPDCLGKLTDFVEAPDEIKLLVHQLFRNVFVVKTRSAAVRLSQSISPACLLVTLKGEVFSGNGTVWAGQEGKNVLLARPRQKRELQNTIESRGKEIVLLKRQLQETSSTLEELTRELRQYEGEQVTVNQELNRLRQINQRASLEMEQHRSRLKWISGQWDDQSKRLKQAQDNQKQIDADLRQLDIQKKSLTDAIHEQSQLLDALPVDEFILQVNHFDTNFAVISRAVLEMEKQLEERNRVAVDRTKRMTELQKRIEQLENQKRLAESEESEFHHREEEINHFILSLTQQISPQEEELEQMEDDYSRLQGDYLAAQQSASLADRLATQAQLDLSRNRETMDSLRRRIEDDFGLVALDYSPEVGGQTPLPFDGIVEQLPSIKELSPEFEESIARQRAILRRMGVVNPDAQSEHKEVKERYEFLKRQMEDLKKADADLRQVIVELDELMQREFLKTFEAVAAEFKKNFTRLFGGGSAQLLLSDEERPIEGGIDIEAKLPGRREQGLSLLSGGERSLTAVALIFSLIKVSPTPFCVMDEVDAMLDEANVGRFREQLMELSRETQFIIITHNRNTVQAADVIYGVTMGRDSASQVISLKLDEVGEDMTR